MADKTLQNGAHPVIDRSRVSHGESRQATLLQMKLQKAQDAGDVETLERLFIEADAFICKIVTQVPDGWLPDGVTLEAADWIAQISEDRYREIIELARADAPGEKKATT